MVQGLHEERGLGGGLFQIRDELSIWVLAQGRIYDFPITAGQAFMIGSGQMPPPEFPFTIFFRGYDGKIVKLTVDGIWVEFPFLRTFQFENLN